MDYYVSRSRAAQNLISIEIPLPACAEPTELILPFWRPGRYEKGPYIENICDVAAVTESGQTLKVVKTSTHRWKVEPTNEAFRFQYAYYAVATDAGGSAISEDLLYINGVNLFMFQADKIDESCKLHLDLTDDFHVACGLYREGNTLTASDFHQLVDAPILASPNLKHQGFDVAL